MHVVEEEARKMTCPMGMASGNYRTCYASNCMAWRWWEVGKTGFCGMAAAPYPLMVVPAQPIEDPFGYRQVTR